MVTLNNSTVSNNSVIGDEDSAGNGGGIYNSRNRMVLSNTTVTGNSATGSGGGIYNSIAYSTGSMTIYDSLVTDNIADKGGGIFNYNSSVRINGSSVANNTASSEGGGIYNSGTVRFNATSTVSGNSEPQCVGVVCPIVE
ncbi:MAG: hypothetical protein M9965_08035 [Anaerolineae bacterium]|nr:hypothetical protein [Anaerolineae bacterium]